MNQLASALSSTSAEKNHRKFKELRNNYEKQETRILHYEGNATSLSIAYVIFGAILCNTIGQYSKNESLVLNRWIPISLLLSVSVAFWLQLARTILRYLGISRQSDICWMEQEKLYHRLYIMDKNGPRQTVISTNKSSDCEKQDLMRKVTASTSRQRYVYIFTVVSALLIFTLASAACVTLHSLQSLKRAGKTGDE